MIEVIDVSKFFHPNWKKLKEQIRVIEKLPKIHPKSNEDSGLESEGGFGWGGWSLTSKNKHHSDGWERADRFINKNKDGKIVTDEAAKATNFNTADHVNYTDIATKELMFCFEEARLKKLYPARARITQLSPNEKTYWHIDSVPEQKMFRLHFVIETNPQSIFKTADAEHHLAENCVYLVNVNDYHMVYNHGETPRTHLIMDVQSPRAREILVR